MNRTIYLQSIKKIITHKWIAMVLLFTALVVPFSATSPRSPITLYDSFTVATLLGLIVSTTTSVIGSAFSVGGRSDYMPLIITRPMTRLTYVVSKWLALSTVIATVSVTQMLIIYLMGSTTEWGWSNTMVACSFVERILVALAQSAVFTMIYLLPTQNMALTGLLIFELVLGLSVIPIFFVIPSTESATSLAMLPLEISGTLECFNKQILPTILGGHALQSQEQYQQILMTIMDFFAPRFHVYDIVTARPFQWEPPLRVIGNTLIAICLASAILNSREYHYDVD